MVHGNRAMIRGEITPRVSAYGKTKANAQGSGRSRVDYFYLVRNGKRGQENARHDHERSRKLEAKWRMTLRKRKRQIDTSTICEKVFLFVFFVQQWHVRLNTSVQC